MLPRACNTTSGSLHLFFFLQGFPPGFKEEPFFKESYQDSFACQGVYIGCRGGGVGKAKKETHRHQDWQN